MIPFLFALISSASAAQVSFQTALSEMVDKDVDVRVQRTNLSASETQVLGARGAFTPQVSLLAQQVNSSGMETAGLPAAGQQYSANVTWNIWRSGADSASLMAALQNRNAQTFQLDLNSLRAEEKAAKALLDLTSKKLILEALKRSEDSAKHFSEIAQARFGRSLLSREEADKVALDAATAEAKRADAEVEYNSARAAVEALLGHADVSSQWPWTKEFERENKLLTQRGGEESRPDILAAGATFETENARGRAAWRSLLPTIDLSYKLAENHPNKDHITMWSSMATLTIPLWSGLSDYTKYRVQVETKYAAEFRLAQTRKDALSEITSAQANYKISLQQYHSRQRTLNMAKRILEQDEARFKIGRANANDLNLDLNRVTGAELLAVQGTQAIHLAYMRLLHAFGRRTTP